MKKQEKKLMSTPKKNAAAKKAETTTTQKDEGIGTHVVHHRSLYTDEDGNTRDATPQEMAAAKGAYITVASRTEDGSVEVASTYDCRIRHYDSGNIGLFIRTSDSLDDAEMDNPVAKDLGEGVEVEDVVEIVGGVLHFSRSCGVPRAAYLASVHAVVHRDARRHVDVVE